MALLALTHTPVEHRVYRAMLDATGQTRPRVGSFSVQHLMLLTGLKSLSAIRRGRAGLVDKFSIERQKDARAGDERRLGAVFAVFTPEEIFERRRAAGLPPYPASFRGFEENTTFGRAIERVIEHYDLSRREAQVALCCAEGLTNGEIGERLFICQQTVKFHLRNVFAKCGVKRRTELIARLFMQSVPD